MISRYTVRTKAKALAQDAGPGSTAIGVQLLLSDPADHNQAVLQALQLFKAAKPNLRVVDQTLAAGGHRLVLAGAGALSGLSGLDAWVIGDTNLLDVWLQWSTADQGRQPLDPNVYRLVQDPGPKIVLELLEDSVSTGEVLRLAFTTPHSLTDSPNTVTDPATGPTVAMGSPATAGNVDNGSHSWVYTYLTAQGETLPSPASSLTVVDKFVNGRVAVTVPAAGDDQGVTGFKVYRTVAGDTGSRNLVGQASTNGGTLTDNVADAGLGANVPSANTAGGLNTVLDAHEDALAVLTASMVLQMAATKAVQNTGNTGFPNDVVERRSQADQFRSRAKELRDLYNTMVGSGPAADQGPASAVRDLDVSAGSGLGFIFHGARSR